MKQGKNTENATNDEGTSAEEPKQLTAAEDRRAALQAAIEGSKEAPEAETKEPDTTDQEDREEPKEPASAPQQAKYQAPAEYSPEEREDFNSLSPKQQEAALRLHRQRQAYFQREFGSTKKLTESVRTYLDVMGKRGLTPEEAMQKAVSLFHEFDGDPEEALRNYAAVRNIDLKKLAGIDDKKSEQNSLPEDVLNDIKSVKNWVEQENTRRQAEALGAVWSGLEGSKNAAGEPRFPDLNDTESGIALAGNIGTLIRNAEFQRAVSARIPGASLADLVVEAYRWHGGRVVESEAPRSQGSQTQIAKSRRASASVPGRSAQTTASAGGGKKFKTYREAAAAALASLNSD